MPKRVFVYRLAALSARAFACDRVAAAAAAGKKRAATASTNTTRGTTRAYPASTVHAL